ncbi:MAG: hypothetical protein CMN30_08590 [Sandaracinus sp.]|nr:hypothetical protein [Sandaracinus sp.]|tara:strand:+ start:473 stop:865 length:393 start_codon:yes stop_codon:yes gene_type:complete
MRNAASLALVFGLVACGPSIPPEQTLRNLQEVMNEPVDDADESARFSQRVQEVVESDALQNMSRPEVQELLGRGDPCSRHPRCMDNGFENDDWFYDVGALGEGYPGPVPLLIVGFDREGKVVRVWNLRTH